MDTIFNGREDDNDDTTTINNNNDNSNTNANATAEDDDDEEDVDSDTENRAASGGRKQAQMLDIVSRLEELGEDAVKNSG